MRGLKRLMEASSVPVIAILTFRHTAGAPYLDAGTGSIIIQALIGGFAAALLLLRIYWKKVKDFFKTKFGRGKKSADIPE